MTKDTSTHAAPIFEIHGTDDKTSLWDGDPEKLLTAGKSSSTVFMVELMIVVV